MERAEGYTYYDDFSLCDTFRGVHPLLTILDPARELDMVKPLIAKGGNRAAPCQSTDLEQLNLEMVGDHADAIIADAYAKGIRGFDLEEAYGR